MSEKRRRNRERPAVHELAKALPAIVGSFIGALAAVAAVGVAALLVLKWFM